MITEVTLLKFENTEGLVRVPADIEQAVLCGWHACGTSLIDVRGHRAPLAAHTYIQSANGRSSYICDMEHRLLLTR